MGEIVHSKCPCKECGNNIEFPAYAARTTVPCPHCGQWTELLPPEALPEPKRVDVSTIVLICCALLVVVGAWWWHGRPAKVTDETAPAPVVKVTAPPIAKVVVPPPPTNPPPPIAVPQAVVTAPVKPTRPKAPDDLKIGPVELEKTPGNSLVYAVGTIKNDSDWQRFGIRIELDLLDKKGDKLGTTQDYKDIIEPRQEWQFHALIPEKRTASAKVTTVKEQE